MKDPPHTELDPVTSQGGKTFSSSVWIWGCFWGIKVSGTPKLNRDKGVTASRNSLGFVCSQPAEIPNSQIAGICWRHKGSGSGSSEGITQKKVHFRSLLELPTLPALGDNR